MCSYVLRCDQVGKPSDPKVGTFAARIVSLLVVDATRLPGSLRVKKLYRQSEGFGLLAHASRNRASIGGFSKELLLSWGHSVPMAS